MFMSTIFRKVLQGPIEINLLKYNLRHTDKSDSSRFMGECVPRGSKVRDKLTQIEMLSYVYWLG